MKHNHYYHYSHSEDVRTSSLTAGAESRRGNMGLSSGSSSTTNNSSSQGGLYSSGSSIDTRYVEELENDFFGLEDRHEAALREKDQLAADLQAQIRTTSELHNTLDQYREKVSTLERRCIHLEEEVKGYR